MAQDIFSVAAFILQIEGKMNAGNPLALETEFHDDRVEIVGAINPQSGQLSALFINLNLPYEGDFVSGIDESTTPFALPRPHTYETPVLQWAGGQVRFIRPGIWQAYLLHLAEQMKKRIESLNLLNGVPVDDTMLFGDIPLGLPPEVLRPDAPKAE
ncbi:MAG: hypothetical protein KME04_15925 [Pleurocapsa minor GSE-CHR-MK-17-07R]|jgi:hypothetical protein|nr:hypothetical protein [Pleurocapsa minor GSE-CHR-MK 17-07R]